MINDKEVPKTVMKMLFKTCCNWCKIHTKNAPRQPHAIVSSIPRNKRSFIWKTFHNSQAIKSPISTRAHDICEGRWGFLYLPTGATLTQGISKLDSLGLPLARAVPKNVYIIRDPNTLQEPCQKYLT